MSSDRRRPRNLLGLLLADPVRKLIAIGLAVSLWFFVDSRITRTVSRTIPLVAVGPQSIAGEQLERLAVVLPTEHVVAKNFYDGDVKIDKVEVRLTGPRFRVEAIEDELFGLQITKFLSLDWTSRTNVELTAADIRRDKPMEQLRIELRPPRIRLDVERVVEWPYKLTLDLVDLQEGLFGERLRRETAQFVPDTAIVLGPAYAIEAFTKRGGKPFRAVLGPSGEKQVAASLELVGLGDLELRFASVPVLTMEVLPQTARFELELPITVDDLALPPELQGLYRPEKRTRLVAIRAGGTLRSTLATLADLGDSSDRRKLNEWAAANLRLLVHLRPESGMANEIEREARLLFVGKGYQSVDPSECLLADPVVVKLQKRP